MQKKRGRKPKGGQVVKKSIKKNPKECNKIIIILLKIFHKILQILFNLN